MRSSPQGDLSQSREAVLADIKPFNRDAAKQQPERWFAGPMDIVGHQLLTRGEKLATLDRWRLNLLSELAAASEGMHTRGHSADQLAILNSIEEARSRLRDPASGRGSV
jgi:hypothetical protein